MSKIQSYQDLLDEKVRLEAVLVIQRATLNDDMIQLKQKWKPTVELLSMLSKFRNKADVHPLISVGVGLLGDVLLGNVLLGRGGWLVRLVPLLVKKYSTHLINKGGTSIIRKMIDRLKTDSNGKPGK